MSFIVICLHSNIPRYRFWFDSFIRFVVRKISLLRSSIVGRDLICTVILLLFKYGTELKFFLGNRRGIHRTVLSSTLPWWWNYRPLDCCVSQWLVEQSTMGSSPIGGQFYISSYDTSLALISSHNLFKRLFLLLPVQTQ